MKALISSGLRQVLPYKIGGTQQSERPFADEMHKTASLRIYF